MRNKSNIRQASAYPLADMVQDIAGIAAIVLFTGAVGYIGVIFR